MSNHSHSTAITNCQPIRIFGALSDTKFFKLHVSNWEPIKCLNVFTCPNYPVTKRDHGGGSQLKISYQYHIDIDDMG